MATQISRCQVEIFGTNEQENEVARAAYKFVMGISQHSESDLQALKKQVIG